MYVCSTCGYISDESEPTTNGLCSDCVAQGASFNIAHIAFYANQVLEDLNIETLPVAFWRGLYEGRGDTSLVPDSLIEAEKEQQRQINRYEAGGSSFIRRILRS